VGLLVGGPAWCVDAIGRVFEGATQFEGLRHRRGTGGGLRFDGPVSTWRDDPVGRLAFEEVPFTDPRVQRLVEEVQAYYVVLYGNPDESPVDPAQFDPPAGRFLLGTVGGEPVAMGGWRMRPDLDQVLGARGAEVKRMFVSPKARRRGHALALLTALEESARYAGADLAVLETGTEQPDAIALYERAGYTPTVRFGHYAGSPTARYFAKRFTGVARGRQEP
jgi:ribosomal protein S18 acetylase RimI-like enzyme